jgi:hypothetical protein
MSSQSFSSQQNLSNNNNNGNNSNNPLDPQLTLSLALGFDGQITEEVLEELMLMEAIQRSLSDVPRTFAHYRLIHSHAFTKLCSI